MSGDNKPNGNFLDHIITEKGEFILFTLPTILSIILISFDPNIGLIGGLFFMFFIYAVICIIDSEYLKYLGYQDESISSWQRFVPPLHLKNRSQLLGKKETSALQNTGGFVAGIFAFLLVGGFISSAGNLEARTCDTVTQLIQDNWGYMSECESVDLEEIAKNRYTGTAYLDDGDTVSVVVHKKKNGDAEVIVTPF